MINANQIEAAVPGPLEIRSRRRTLFALPVLLVLAFLAHSYERLYWFWHGNHLIARDVKQGAAADFGGSRWKLINVSERQDIKRARIPPDFALVVVDIEVAVGTAKSVTRVGDITLEEHWGACKLSLVDRDGRTWTSVSLGYTPQLYPDNRRDIATCGSHSQAKLPADAIVTVRETFLVPKDVVPLVSLSLSVDGEQPWFLQFER